MVGKNEKKEDRWEIIRIYKNSRRRIKCLGKEIKRIRKIDVKKNLNFEIVRLHLLEELQQ